MSKLEQIQLKGFKSIRDIDLELRHLNILIGANGAGKSNFIHFFRLMNKLVQQDLQFFVAQQGGIDCFLHFGRQVTDAIEIVLLFKYNHYVCRLVPDQTGQLIFKEEYCEWLTDLMDEPNRFKKQALASGGDKESGLSKKSIANQITDYLSDWQIYHFHDTSDTAKVKQSGSIYDNERLRPQADNLAAFLFSIQQTEQYRKIVQTIQRVAPFFQDFILKPEKTAPEHIRLRWKHRGTDDYFDANALSDGTLRFICLTTLLLQPSLPLLILLDEPELGLHPYAMQLLAGMMRSAAQKTQIIASSQSVTLANQFEWPDLLIIESVDNASQFKRLSEEQIKVWLDEYRIGDLWEKNLIGGIMLRIGISVEGATEREFINQLIMPYLSERDILITPITMNGNISLDRIRHELLPLLGSFDIVTTFYDLYGFKRRHGQNAEQLEQKILELVDMRRQRRLIPYIQP